MPRLAELRRQYFGSSPAVANPNADEVFVSDTRSGMDSKQMLENKFGRALLLEQSRQAASSVVLKPRPR